MDLQDLATLVEEVGRDLGITAEVAGVMPSEGDGCYAEVIADIARPGADVRRISLGLQRDGLVETLRRQVAQELTAGADKDKPGL